MTICHYARLNSAVDTFVDVLFSTFLKICLMLHNLLGKRMLYNQIVMLVKHMLACCA